MTLDLTTLIDKLQNARTTLGGKVTPEAIQEEDGYAVVDVSDLCCEPVISDVTVKNGRLFIVVGTRELDPSDLEQETSTSKYEFVR